MWIQWVRNLHELAERYPELKRHRSKLRRSVAQLLKTHGFFHTSGDGICLAVEMAAYELGVRAAGGEDKSEPNLAARRPAKPREIGTSAEYVPSAAIVAFPKLGERPAVTHTCPCPFTFADRWCYRPHEDVNWQARGARLCRCARRGNAAGFFVEGARVPC